MQKVGAARLRLAAGEQKQEAKGEEPPHGCPRMDAPEGINPTNTIGFRPPPGDWVTKSQPSFAVDEMRTAGSSYTGKGGSKRD